jgi:LysM repeat protein
LTSIAEKKLGSAKLETKLKEFNGLENTALYPGQKLKLPPQDLDA